MRGLSVHRVPREAMSRTEEGVETFEEAFLAHLVDERTGQTIYEQLSQDGRVELATPLTPALLPANDG